MQQITVTLTTATGVVIQKNLIKPPNQPVQLSLPPGTKLAVDVQGPNPKQVGAKGAGKLNVKRVGDDLVIEGEGERLVQVSQYYDTKDVSVGTTQWDLAEPVIQVADKSTPEHKAEKSHAVDGSASGSASDASASVPVEGAAQKGEDASTASSKGFNWAPIALGVGLAGGGGGGGGGAGGSDAVASTVISGTIAAGPVLSSNSLKVNLYKVSDGSWVQASLDSTTGQFTANLGNYSGLVVVKVTSSGTSEDFKDEATGLNMHLDATLLSVASVAAGSSVLHVNPVTTLAAQKAGVNVDGTPGVNLSASSVSAANATVAKSFGLSGDITQIAAKTTINADGTTVAAPNELGMVLAALSGMAAKSGSQQGVITDLLAAMGADGSITDHGLQKLLEGARAADPNGTMTGKIASILSKGQAASGFSVEALSSSNVMTSTSVQVGTVLSGKVAAGTREQDLSIQFGVMPATAGASPQTTAGQGKVTLDTTTWTWRYSLVQADVNTLLGGLTNQKDGPESIQLCVGQVPKATMGVFYDNGSNDSPLAISFGNVRSSLPADLGGADGVKLADILIVDPDGNSGVPGVVSADSTKFAIKTNAAGKYELWLAGGVVLNANTSLNAAVAVGGKSSSTLTIFVAPTMKLFADTGTDPKDGITQNGKVEVEDLVSGAGWQYSLDGGSTWQNGSGNSFTVEKDGHYNLKVRQSLGVSSSLEAALDLNLDTQITGVSIAGFDMTGNATDGIQSSSLTDVVGTGMTHIGGAHCALLEGTSEANATVTFTLGGESKTVVADATGYWNYRLTATDFSHVGVGTETIAVTNVTDKAGNSSSAIVSHDVTFNAVADTSAHWGSGYSSTYLDALIAGGTGWSGTTITYSFAPGSGATAWTSSEKAAFANACAVYEHICNLRFIEASYSSDGYTATSMVLNKVPSSTWNKPTDTWITLADFMYPRYGINEEGHYSDSPFGAVQGRFNYEYSGWSNLSAGGMGFDTLIHELGHGLGLSHPFDSSPKFPGVNTYEDYGDYNLNQGIWTVMSYLHGWPLTSPGATTRGYTWGYSKTPMTFDVAALQTLYGANTSYKTGDDTYTLPTTETIGTGWECIWDAGGVDTISNAGASSSCQINLNAYPIAGGVASESYVSYNSGSKIAGGFTVADGAVIENAVGGNGSDTLIGNGVANTLTGGAGNDSLTGGGEADSFVFNAALGAANIDTITDFSASQGDKIKLDDSIFGRLTVGTPLSSSQFKSAANVSASDTDDFILYNNSTGALYYDSDGNGSCTAVQFAVLQNKPTDLTYAQFVVI